MGLVTNSSGGGLGGLGGGGGAGGLEIGSIVDWAGTASNVPNGFLIADGSAVSRLTYDKLFAVVGTQFGIGDGSTTFNLPNVTPGAPLTQHLQASNYTYNGGNVWVDRRTTTLTANIGGTATITIYGRGHVAHDSLSWGARHNGVTVLSHWMHYSDSSGITLTTTREAHPGDTFYGYDYNWPHRGTITLTVDIVEHPKPLKIIKAM